MHTFISNFLRQLPLKLREKDKIQHMVWSFGLLLGALAFMSPFQAFVAVSLLGLAKEFWDLRYGSGFCGFDLVGNLLGCVAALAVAGAVLALVQL